MQTVVTFVAGLKVAVLGLLCADCNATYAIITSHVIPHCCASSLSLLSCVEHVARCTSRVGLFVLVCHGFQVSHPTVGMCSKCCYLPTLGELPLVSYQG